MADALASGASVRKDVGVQVPPSAPGKSTDFERIQYFFFSLKSRLAFLTTNRRQNRLHQDAAQPLCAANRKRRSVRSAFFAFYSFSRRSGPGSAPRRGSDGGAHPPASSAHRQSAHACRRPHRSRRRIPCPVQPQSIRLPFPAFLHNRPPCGHTNAG